MDNICPQDYTCSFVQVHPRIIEHTHTVGPWWQHTAGWLVAIIAIIAIASVIAYSISLIQEGHKDRSKRNERQLEQKHKLAIEEQKTMQIDMAKGDPEMLKMIREMK